MDEWVDAGEQGQGLTFCLLQDPGEHPMVGTMFLLTLTDLLCL